MTYRPRHIEELAAIGEPVSWEMSFQRFKVSEPEIPPRSGVSGRHEEDGWNFITSQDRCDYFGVVAKTVVKCEQYVTLAGRFRRALTPRRDEFEMLLQKEDVPL